LNGRSAVEWESSRSSKHPLSGNSVC